MTALSLGRLLVLFVWTLQSAATAQPCVGARSAPRLDHVILVVGDLDRASEGFTMHGFRLKPGRLHPNNLLNRHIKFRDGSSIELMTVQGRPGDAMAQRYADLLSAGEGGVYVALAASDMTAAERAGEAVRLESRRSSSGPWQFLGFPSDSPAAAVFFTTGGTPVRDPESLVSHEPDVEGLAEAWVTGGPALSALLARLGANSCGAARSSNGEAGERWALSRGSIVIVPPRPEAPRLLGVVLQRRASSEGTVRPHPRFWISYRG